MQHVTVKSCRCHLRVYFIHNLHLLCFSLISWLSWFPFSQSAFVKSPSSSSDVVVLLPISLSSYDCKQNMLQALNWSWLTFFIRHITKLYCCAWDCSIVNSLWSWFCHCYLHLEFTSTIWASCSEGKTFTTGKTVTTPLAPCLKRSPGLSENETLCVRVCMFESMCVCLCVCERELLLVLLFKESNCTPECVWSGIWTWLTRSQDCTCVWIHPYLLQSALKCPVSQD